MNPVSAAKRYLWTKVRGSRKQASGPEDAYPGTGGLPCRSTNPQILLDPSALFIRSGTPPGPSFNIVPGGAYNLLPRSKSPLFFNVQLMLMVYISTNSRWVVARVFAAEWPFPILVPLHITTRRSSQILVDFSRCNRNPLNLPIRNVT